MLQLLPKRSDFSVQQALLGWPQCVICHYLLSVRSEVKEGSKVRQASVFQLTVVDFGLEIRRVSEIQGAEPSFWDTGDCGSQLKDEF